MKNKIEDMRDHLFAELERLGDESLKGTALESELKRAKAVSEVCQTMINSAKVEVDFISATNRKGGTEFIDQEARPVIGGSVPRIGVRQS